MRLGNASRDFDAGQEEAPSLANVEGVTRLGAPDWCQGLLSSGSLLGG